MKKSSLFVLSLLFLFTACKKDDDTVVKPTSTTTKFKLTIENVFEGKANFDSGLTEAIPPGGTHSFSFHAGKGAKLSFATMFVQSNDLFYAPGSAGIDLFDANGMPRTGDLTAEIDLWDAGTEVNQEPGVGADQAPRQSGANTGTAENSTVRLLSEVADGYTYPMDEAVLKLTLNNDGGTMFTATIQNLSNSASLATPLAPGVWVVHESGQPIFENNQTATNGLEALAEDGGNGVLADVIAAETGYFSPYAPGVWAIHSDAKIFFESGIADKGQGLEALAEDGDPAALASATEANANVLKSGVFNTPVGASAPGPLLPGGKYEFSFEAEDGDRLSLATMLVQTNDLFYAFADNGIALFNNGAAISGDLTNQLLLWDAGTELNEYPGAGANQPVRGGGNSGPDENGTVKLVNDGFSYPATSAAIKVTITRE